MQGGSSNIGGDAEKTKEGIEHFSSSLQDSQESGGSEYSTPSQLPGGRSQRDESDRSGESWKLGLEVWTPLQPLLIQTMKRDKFSFAGQHDSLKPSR